MASSISPTLHLESPQWRHLLRASLRECTYLPDPIARVYMRDYCYSCPDGRVGRRRHQLLAPLITPDAPELPKDEEGWKQLVEKSRPSSEGKTELPAAIQALMRSQMNNGVVSSSRIRPQIKTLEPVIPEKNSWGRPMPQSRVNNMLTRWYGRTMECLLPPLPPHEVATLDGLITGDVPWSPKPRRAMPSPTAGEEPPEENTILSFLVDGPQKSHTFEKYVEGRPHVITYRLMSRIWRRISCHVPRMSWDEEWSKWNISWDTPKDLPQVAFEVLENANLDAIFGQPLESRTQKRKEPALS
ncbi:hypothetical protein N7468_003398 [Penicillium chermesinum]|uniref:Uncharacterized protein n=1 Tax=Penicillium chermesinum TaxID=63820 RepID=A0A9W9TTB7_9EURO|nr:uncharacterized protein N7468_003398 [Penicillium chermesinum]KAJ5238779.1 hypothetical protein N7468_003398 [Penicillium chermesinum]